MRIGGEEEFHEAPIARGEGQGVQLVQRAPREGGVFEALRFAEDFDGDEGDQELRARVGDGEEFGTDGGHGDAELFGELAAGGVCVGFSGVDLAAGEFEEVAVAFVGRALADEEGVGAADDGGDDADRGRGHCAERAARVFVVPGLRPSAVDSVASYLPVYCRIAALLSAPMPDLDSEALDFRAASESFKPTRTLRKRDLESLRLPTTYQGHTVPTVGGLLLFGRDRERHFPDAWITIVRCGSASTDRSAAHVRRKNACRASVSWEPPLN